MNPHSFQGESQGTTLRGAGVSARSVIAEAKAKVEATELAGRISGPGIRRGREIYFVCPLHDDHDPSLRVNPSLGLWRCDPCAEGGDLITLAQRAWKIENPAEAAAHILLEFGFPVPPRPRSWHARQDRQKPLRDRIEAARIEHIRLLVFRLIWMPWLRRLPEGIRGAATDDAWGESLWLAERIYSERRDA